LAGYSPGRLNATPRHPRLPPSCFLCIPACCYAPVPAVVHAHGDCLPASFLTRPQGPLSPMLTVRRLLIKTLATRNSCCNIRLKYVKYLEHKLAIYVYSHYNICNIEIKHLQSYNILHVVFASRETTLTIYIILVFMVYN
jgi:hypothetical protein